MARILVIDDDTLMRSLLKTVLSGAGYEVLEAADGNEGLKSYRNSPTDLVITDLIMPEKEGIDTIMELRREFSTVKIIAISGGYQYGQNNNLSMAGKLGAMRTLAKPFNIVDLLAVVREVLKSDGGR